MAQQAKYKVLTRNQKTEAVIRPPFDTADHGNVNGLVIKNSTLDDILVSLPGGIFDFNNDGNADPGQVVTIASGTSQTIRTGANATTGIFSFKVFCKETFSFAQGNSDPEIIVE